MKARCIMNGQAYVVGGTKPRWCEVGQELDIDVKRMGGLPKHFEAIKAKVSDKPPEVAVDKAATDKAAADKAAADKAANLAPGAPKGPVTTDNL